jgi:hypothetical protein
MLGILLMEGTCGTVASDGYILPDYLALFPFVIIRKDL